MKTGSNILIPRFLDSFQGFSVIDIKKYISDQRVEIHSEKKAQMTAICCKCCEPLGHYHDRCRHKVKHQKLFNFDVEVYFFIEKRKCLNCKKNDLS